MDEKKDNLLLGINHSKCGLIEVGFLLDEINLISCTIDANSVLNPPSQQEESETLLPGFIWREEEKPKSKKDLFLEDEPPSSEKELT